MKGLAYSSLRVGKRYWLKNYGEKHEFEIIEALPPDDFKLKDLHTLELYTLLDLIRYGQSADCEIREMN